MQYILLVSCYRDSTIRNVKTHFVEADSFEAVETELRDKAKSIKREGNYDRVFCTITEGPFGPVIESFRVEGETLRKGAHS